MAVAQVVLTASESRVLIAKAVSESPEVKHAVKHARIILCTSSISPHILDALGYGPIAPEDRGKYVCGMIRAEGLCTSNFDLVKDVTVIDRGTLTNDAQHIKAIINGMGRGDIYIKSPNILDRNGRAGVLAGAPACGTVGRMTYGLTNQQHAIIAPTLLLKTAPVDLLTSTEHVSAATFRRDAATFVKYSCGMPVNLVVLPERTKVITELDALQQVFRLKGKPIAMTGVGSGTDAVVLSVDGAEADVDAFWQYLCQIKGTPPTTTYPSNCSDCPDAKNPTRCGGFLKLQK